MNITPPSASSASIRSSSDQTGKFGNQCPVTHDRSLNAPICFRICGIPSEWNKRNLEEALYTIDPALALETFRISTLFPACCSSSQTALLTVERCTEYLRFSDSDDEKHYVFPADDINKPVRLRIDKHFYDLTPLNAPEEPILADIIAITGLGGHAFGSWRSRVCPNGRPLDRQMWLRDFLPDQYPQIRVMTYGYDSSLVRPNGFTLDDHTEGFMQSINNSRRNYPERPIIFIGHSLGGIILAKVLIGWANGKNASNLFKCIRGVFFFGTPHNGLRVEELKHTFIGKGQDNKNEGILTQLEESSNFLQNQRDELTEALGAFEGRIFSFFETEMTNSVREVEPGVFKRSGDPFQMVKRTSAILSMPKESHFAIMSNHTDMVKFKSFDDKVFQDVVTCMRTCFAQRVDVLKHLERNVVPEKQTVYIDQSRYLEGHFENEEPADCFLALQSMDYKDWSSEMGQVQYLVYNGFPNSSLLLPYILRSLRNNEESGTILHFRNISTDEEYSSKTVTAQVVLTFFCQAIRAHSEDTRQFLLHQFLDALLTALKDEDVIKVQTGDIESAFESLVGLSNSGTLWSTLAQALVCLAGSHRCPQLGEQRHAPRNYKIIVDVNGSMNPCWGEIVPKLRQMFLSPPASGFLTAKVLIIDSANSLGVWGVSVQYDKERGECLDSLNFENPRYAKIAEHHTHTLSWLWQSPEYKSWLSMGHQDSSMLFIEGKPGSGKSTLVRYFVDHFTPPTDAIVAKFFYSARAGESETDHRNMLKAILYQILKEDESFFVHFQSFYRRNGGIEWSSKHMKDILRACKMHPWRRNIFLILDAMDESTCTDRVEIVRFLHELSVPNDSGTGCVIKVFLASRPINELQLVAGPWRREILMQEFNRPDIERYTRNILQNEEFSSVAVETKQEIAEYILRFSDGVFLWVFLVLKELSEFAMNGVRRSALIQFLKSLPKSLESLYESMVRRLANNRPQARIDGRRTLQFCLFSHRAVDLVELQHALAVPGLQDDEIDFRYWEREIPQEMRRYLTHCAGGFVDIIERGKLAPVVQVMHQTVRDFFFRPSEIVRKADLDISCHQDSQNMIQLTCVRFLEIVVKETSSFTSKALDGTSITSTYRYLEYLETRPFLRYSLEYLKENRQHIAPEIEGRLLQLSDNLLGLLAELPYSSTAVVLSDVLLPQPPSQEDTSIQFHLDVLVLHSASSGYLTATRILLATSASMDAKDTAGRTPLHLAARGGHYIVTQLLLDSHPAGRERDDNEGMTPLHHAAASGHTVIVGLLLNYHVRVDHRDKAGLRALHHAVLSENEGSIRLLLDNSADINALDGKDRNALHYASERGYDSIAQLLIAKGAHINALDDKGCHALHYASKNSYVSIVQLLLTLGAYIDAPDSKGRSALHYASKHGHDSIVQLLIAKGAYINASDRKGRDALHHASRHGHDTVAYLLLAKGVYKDAPDCNGRNVLHYASQHGQDTIVQLLTRLGWDIDATDHYGYTALHYAIQNNHNNIIKVLSAHNQNGYSHDKHS